MELTETIGQELVYRMLGVDEKFLVNEASLLKNTWHTNKYENLGSINAIQCQ